MTFVLEAGLPTEFSKRKCGRWRGRASAGVRSRAATPKWLSTARPTDVHHHRRDRPAAAGRDIDPRSGTRRAIRFCSRARSAITESRFCWRAANWIWKRDLRSDTRSVLPLVEALARCRRRRGALDARSDARRRGYIAERTRARCGLGVVIHEDVIPVRDAVRGACELLGLDPLHIANEGQFLAVVAPEARRRSCERCAQRLAAKRRDHRRNSRAAGGRRAGHYALRRQRASWTCWWAIRCRAYAERCPMRDSVRPCSTQIEAAASGP